MLDGQQHGSVFSDLSGIFSGSVDLIGVDNGPARCWQGVVWLKG